MLNEAQRYLLCNASSGVPLHPLTHLPIDIHDETAWVTHADAFKYCQSDELVGMVIYHPDKLFFLDLDDHIKDNVASDLAAEFIKLCAGCYIEVSKSGEGLHIIGRYEGECPLHTCKNKDAGLELYTENRYVALTGRHAVGSMQYVLPTATLNSIIERFFKPAEASIDGKTCKSDLLLPDMELLQKAMSSKSAFGYGVTFKDLWDCNVDALSVAYPATDGRPYDYNRADAALAAHLAFWTGGKPEQMERMFNMSALATREKWQSRADYRTLTINNAIAICTNHYTPPEPPAFTSSEEQQTLFAGCAYIASLNKILTPNGMLLKQEAFRAMYGGRTFAIGKKATTTNAWRAFTESQLVSYPKVDMMCFRPEVPEKIIESGTMKLVNTYTPIQIKKIQGDVTPFLSHIKAMLPRGDDALILISYLAALIQNPGKKFQWAPLLQGVQGNGKTLITQLAEYCVGEQYTHRLNASDLNGNGLKYTGWLYGKLLVCIEEIYVANRWEAIEALKHLITNKRCEIQFKGVDQTTTDNRANFILVSNHRDAIPTVGTDRRYCPLYTAQQSIYDLDKLGWRGVTYFPKLVNWLDNGGYGYVAHWLSTYSVPDKYNPATVCIWAPDTSCSVEVMTVGTSKLEEEIREAVESGRYGFCGGWISSWAMDNLCAEHKIKTSRAKRSETLAALGYTVPADLPSGRVTRMLANEGRPKLFVLPSAVRKFDAATDYQTAQKEGS